MFSKAWLSAFGLFSLGLSSPVPNATSSADPASSLGFGGLSDCLLVDLGYGLYNGTYNSSTGLNVWKGIRYAAPPVGKLRWQAPQKPVRNRTVVQADAFGPTCPQSWFGGSGVPFTPGNEDCLFVDVWAPANKKNLPVFIWIHGGGYGLGDGTQDMTAFLNSNNNQFLVVSLQYRLGAFGFLSSAEVKAKGVLNAGILDQQFVFKWVQQYITQFGGDPTSVTIMGESAGGGSVMLHAMAYGGTQGTKYWQNGIAASPYDPGQDPYNAAQPTNHYYSFAQKAGCPSSGAVFDCLVSKDTLTLQAASNNESQNTPFGAWGFLPVTDGTLIVDIPSVQLNQQRVNGKRVLIGNNANEGSLFVPGNITTQDDLVAWIKLDFPGLSDAQITQLLAVYASSSDPVNPNATRMETNGYGPPYAVNVSQSATGQQQRAFNIYAEATFVCPSYWIDNAFTTNGRKAYHYQYSVPYASHASDLAAYFGPPTPNQGPDFTNAFRKIYGNFVLSGNPSISNAVANGARSAHPNAANPASMWPVWTLSDQKMINLNESGGVPTPSTTPDAEGPIIIYTDPGLMNNLTLANAYTWEGGRGQRCEFWRSVGASVPE